MVGLRTLVGFAALAVVSSTAFAFQEQQPSPGVSGGAPAVLSVPALTTPLAPDVATSKGTQVRIPGLGTLGVIPKMDFGLELLYGAADSPSKRLENSKTDGQDDVLIRGSIKHKF